MSDVCRIVTGRRLAFDTKFKPQHEPLFQDLDVWIWMRVSADTTPPVPGKRTADTNLGADSQQV